LSLELWQPCRRRVSKEVKGKKRENQRHPFKKTERSGTGRTGNIMQRTETLHVEIEGKSEEEKELGHKAGSGACSRLKRRSFYQ